MESKIHESERQFLQEQANRYQTLGKQQNQPITLIHGDVRERCEGFIESYTEGGLVFRSLAGRRLTVPWSKVDGFEELQATAAPVAPGQARASGSY